LGKWLAEPKTIDNMAMAAVFCVATITIERKTPGTYRDRPVRTLPLGFPKENHRKLFGRKGLGKKPSYSVDQGHYMMVQ